MANVDTSIPERSIDGRLKVKEIRVRFAGIEKAPDSEELSIIYIPDTTQILQAGRRYRVIIEGLSFETHGATKKSKPGKKGH